MSAKEVSLDEAQVSAWTTLAKFVSFTNSTVETLDRDALARALRRAKGRDRVQSITIEPTSRLTDLRPLVEFSRLRNLFVRGLAIQSLTGIGDLSRLEALEVATGRNRRRSLDALAESAIKKLILVVGGHSDMSAVATCPRLQELEVSGCDVFLAQDFSRSHLNSVSVFRGRFESLGDLHAAPALRYVHVANCSRLRCFAGDNSGIRTLLVSSCNQVDWATIATFSDVEAVYLTGIPEVGRLSAFCGLPRLRELIVEGNARLDVESLSNLSPRLERLVVYSNEDEALDTLSRGAPGVVVANARREWRH